MMGGSPSTPVRPLATSLKHCTLWKADRSPACRAVMMALDAMNIDVREVDVNLDKGEQKSSTIGSMNPLQTLPILKDKDFILSDSHAITTYMASRYGSEMTKFLLPTTPRARACVDQFLHFNSSVLYPQYRAAANPILYGSMRNVGTHTYGEIQGAYAAMERMLSERAFFSNGHWPSLGDISMIATLSTLNVLVPIDVIRYPKLTCWLRRMSEEKFYCTANMKGLTEFTRRIEFKRIEKSEELPTTARICLEMCDALHRGIEVFNTKVLIGYLTHSSATKLRRLQECGSNYDYGKH